VSVTAASVTMPAIALARDRTIRLTERAVPEPADGELLLRVECCGICGSDLHSPDLPDLFPGGFVLGHEFVGTVLSAGSSAETPPVGARVVVNPNGNVCGTCDACLAGRPNHCRVATRRSATGVHRDGGLAPFATVEARAVYRVPEGLMSRRAAWTETLATAVRAVRHSGLRLGDPVMVSGAGPVGLLAIQLLEAAGAGRVSVVEPSSFRRRAALQVGADDAADPSDVPRASDGAPVLWFECSGAARALDTAVRVVPDGGEVIVVGYRPRWSPSTRSN